MTDKLDIDVEELGKLILEMTPRYRAIVELFPKGNESMLRHLAASSIHLAFFMRDFHDVHKGTKTAICPMHEKEFLKKCGCDFNTKDK
jgi:hypothetical protein